MDGGTKERRRKTVEEELRKITNAEKLRRVHLTVFHVSQNPHVAMVGRRNMKVGEKKGRGPSATTPRVSNLSFPIHSPP